MGHYLSQPQTSTHSLGQNFIAQYKRDHGLNSTISTAEVSNTIQDALNYKQLYTNLELLLENVSELDHDQLISALQDITEKAPAVQIVYPSRLILRELQEHVMHLRQLLEKQDKDISAQHRIEASLYAAEHSVQILEQENQKLLEQLNHKDVLIKQVHSEARKLKFNNLEPLVDKLQITLIALEKNIHKMEPQTETTLQKLEELITDTLNTLKQS